MELSVNLACCQFITIFFKLVIRVIPAYLALGPCNVLSRRPKHNWGASPFLCSSFFFCVPDVRVKPVFHPDLHFKTCGLGH